MPLTCSAPSASHSDDNAEPTMHVVVMSLRSGIGVRVLLLRRFRPYQCLASFVLELLLTASASSQAAGQERASATLPNFDRVDIDLVGDFILRKGEQYGYSIAAERSVIQAVTFHVKSGELLVRAKRNFKTDKPIQIEISAPTLKRVRLGGSENVVSVVPTQQSFEARTDGSGSLRATNIAAIVVTALTTGAGDIELTGQTERLKVVASSSGDAVLDHLAADQVRVESTGSSTVRVHAKMSLHVTVTGAGTVAYRGNPLLFDTVTGAGEVTRLGR